MAEIFPARAQRVTVFGLTRNMAATSEGVSRASSSWGCIGLHLEGSVMGLVRLAGPSRMGTRLHAYPTSAYADSLRKKLFAVLPCGDLSRPGRFARRSAEGRPRANARGTRPIRRPEGDPSGVHSRSTWIGSAQSAGRVRT